MAENENNMMKYMANPKAFTLRRWFSELLKDKYPPHDQVIERISAALVTERDMQEFGRLIGEIFEGGYRKAIDDYREQFEKLGIKINVVAGS